MVNYVNDYLDGVCGIDKNWVGFLRLVGFGCVKFCMVLMVVLVFFGIVVVVGVILVVKSGEWWLFVVGVVCIVVGWFYIGGKWLYGYYVLGEVVVFLFFGVVLVVGMVYM